MCTFNVAVPQPVSLGSAKKEWRGRAADDHTGCVTPSQTQPRHKHAASALWRLHVTETKAVLLNSVNSPLSGSLKHQLSLLPWVLFSKYLESFSPRKLEGSHTELYLGHSERRIRSIFVWVFFFLLYLTDHPFVSPAGYTAVPGKNKSDSREKEIGESGACLLLSITQNLPNPELKEGVFS